MKNKIVKYILFVLLVALMFLPLLQQVFPNHKAKQLSGYSEKTPKPILNKDNWFEGEYQNKIEKYINENIGYRDIFIRNYNQINYSLFKTSKGCGVYIGKNNYLYEYGYVMNYSGLNYEGEDTIKSRVSHLSIVRDSLKSKGIDLVVIIAPGKANYYSEYLPSQFKNSKRRITNYNIYDRELKKKNINYLDFDSWMLSLKGKTKYRLYSNTGVHWGEYACYLAADSITKYFENLYSINLPHIKINSVNVSKTMYGTDDDLEKLMNIYTNIDDEPMPHINFKVVDSVNKDKLKVLVIGDSYYNGLSALGLDRYVFNDSEFWYYYKTVHKNTNFKGYVSDYDNIKKKIEKYKVVMILMTEGTLDITPKQVFENLYCQYSKAHPNIEYENKINKYIRLIKANKDWFDSVKKKAKDNNVSIEKAVYNDAVYMVEQEKKKNNAK